MLLQINYVGTLTTSFTLFFLLLNESIAPPPSLHPPATLLVLDIVKYNISIDYINWFYFSVVILPRVPF